MSIRHVSRSFKKLRVDRMRLVVLYRMLQSELICESKAEIKVFRQIGNVKVLVSLAMFLAEDFITAQTAPDDVRTSMNFNVGIH